MQEWWAIFTLGLAVGGVLGIFACTLLVICALSLEAFVRNSPWERHVCRLEDAHGLETDGETPVTVDALEAAYLAAVAEVSRLRRLRITQRWRPAC